MSTSSPRKTLKVRQVVEKANRILELSASDSAVREGVIALVESVLLEANAYAGFRYLASEYLPAEEQTLTSVLRSGYDPTRRAYILNSRI